MPDIRLERDLNISPGDLWSYISTTAGLLEWWGPEGLTVPDHRLDFTRTGPWHSVMVNGEGKRYKVSGQVTHVKTGTSVGFTWGWHDDEDRRGEESHVTLTVVDRGNGLSRLVLDHVDLPNTEAAEHHTEGWTSSLRKLERAPANTSEGV